MEEDDFGCAVCSHYCDACGQRATQRLAPDTSPYCADWFVGLYCADCYDRVESEMKKQTEDEAAMIFSCPMCHKVLAKEEGKPFYKATLVPVGGAKITISPKQEKPMTICPRCNKVVVLAKGVL